MTTHSHFNYSQTRYTSNPSNPSVPGYIKEICSKSLLHMGFSAKSSLKSKKTQLSTWPQYLFSSSSNLTYLNYPSLKESFAEQQLRLNCGETNNMFSQITVGRLTRLRDHICIKEKCFEEQKCFGHFHFNKLLRICPHTCPTLTGTDIFAQ